MCVCLSVCACVVKEMGREGRVGGSVCVCSVRECRCVVRALGVCVV